LKRPSNTYHMILYSHRLNQVSYADFVGFTTTRVLSIGLSQLAIIYKTPIALGVYRETRALASPFSLCYGYISRLLTASLSFYSMKIYSLIYLRIFRCLNFKFQAGKTERYVHKFHIINQLTKLVLVITAKMELNKNKTVA
jgi:hypothetical protein